MEEFLGSVQLESLVELFQKEHITMDVLVEMSNEDLQSIGVTAFGHRHKILRKVKDLTCTEDPGEPVTPIHVHVYQQPTMYSVHVVLHVLYIIHGTRLVAVVMFLSYITDSSPAPPPDPPEPVGVASAQHTGTQLIELLLTDKDFIAVSEEVRALLTHSPCRAD